MASSRCRSISFAEPAPMTADEHAPETGSTAPTTPTSPTTPMSPGACADAHCARCGHCPRRRPHRPSEAVDTLRREGTLLDSDPTCIPPITKSRPRTLVLCFDGTGDKFDNDISNIAMIMSMLKKDDRNVQMCYYQAGIGTDLSHHITTPGLKTLEKVVDQGVAWFLSQHVKDGYEFLMQNYVRGDKICLFGFSRGAYTARALAGMLHKVGLLPKDNKQQVPFAWRMYKDESEDGWKLSKQFKDAFCANIIVDFIGVFDTVSSVGLFGSKLPFTASNFGIKHFRHAMALDERRARFKVNHWHRVRPECEQGSGVKLGKSVRKGHEGEFEDGSEEETDVKEVWFAGGHADVGGGNVLNGTPHALARIPLRWMVRETFNCDSGILWDIDGLKAIGLDADLLYPEVVVRPMLCSTISLNGASGEQSTLNPFDSHSRTGSRADSMSTTVSVPLEKGSITFTTTPLLSSPFSKDTEQGKLSAEEHERLDALSRSFDYLKLAKIWWFLELFPTKGYKQHKTDEHIWNPHYFINFGRGRCLPRNSEGTLVHRSVQIRMKEHPKYKKCVHKDLENTNVVWVD